MREVFLAYYRQIGKVAVASLWVLFAFLLATLGCALLGFERAVSSFSQCSLVMASFTGVAFVLLAVSYLGLAVSKRFDSATVRSQNF